MEKPVVSDIVEIEYHFNINFLHIIYSVLCISKVILMSVITRKQETEIGIEVKFCLLTMRKSVSSLFRSSFSSPLLSLYLSPSFPE